MIGNENDKAIIWTFYNHFQSFFHQLHKYISQNWGSDRHFGVPNLYQELWHKLQFCFCFHFFHFVRKKNENLQLTNGHFTTIYGRCSANCNKIFHKTEVQTVILRYLVYLCLDWIKSYDIILVKNIFFSCLKMHYNRAILPKWILASPKETSSHLFKMAIFPKFFGTFMRHIIR